MFKEGRIGKRKRTTIEADSLRDTAELRLGQSHRTLDQTERLAQDTRHLDRAE